MQSALIKPVTLQSAVQETYDKKTETIRYSKNQDKIITLENLYIDYYFNKKHSLDDLFQPSKKDNSQPDIIKELILSIANGFYRSKKHSTRLALEDLISAGYEASWKTIIKYNYQDKFWLYQHLKKNIRNACIDVLRREGLTKDRSGNKHQAFHFASDLNINEADTFRIEEDFLLRDALRNVVEEFTVNEMKVYNLFLNADNLEKVTLDILCGDLNLKYRQQAKRLLELVRVKLENTIYSD